MKRRFVPGAFQLKVLRSHSGRGLFTQERIPKGSCVIEYFGRPATAKQIKENRGKYLFWTSNESMIDGNIPANTARFINHSCAPNCEIVLSKRRIYVFALRAIELGEELSYDYGEEYFEIHLAGACRCAKCSM
ncbi:MAG: SET domain-containing protein-lysine N-methyltransferase [Hyphomicrobium zavarzinii]|uniref:SET domain-containing protein n=1 Tax=Hyphomicrobium zavarzinii TaxID=48292 RepID=UPI001A3BE3B7|nr:SET domain-containing protein-lysine N-methyltransferase [Hyphomicrobium zavarzinii]MBL8844327.1 SET domain-containing protein-lysine N-methyltransferase [Hyphomicrobium zavarzinii]